MGKPKIPNFSNVNKKLRNRIERYVALINNVYDKVAIDAANLATMASYDSSKPFSFSDYPLTKVAVKDIMSYMHNAITGVLMASTSEEWKNCNLVQDLVADKVLRAYASTTKRGEDYVRYYDQNNDALKAFQTRKENGMDLSDKVWDLTAQCKSELEQSISVAMEQGTSATSLAAKIKQYLNEPDKRFKRYKERREDGSVKWHLSNHAKAYHPKQGAYRSSAKNAQRLARTEINMAYRTAEQKRWEQFDFVVGYEVKTTYSEKHVTDICDTLAGKYPKDFKFTGWHPNCMCYCIPILKTEDEFLMYDEENPLPSINEVRSVPENFTKWIESNKERIDAAEKRGKLPYFIQENKGYIQKILKPDYVTPNYGSAMKLGRGATKEAMKIVENIGIPELTEAQKENIRELAKVLGIQQKEIKPMSFLEADQGASNPIGDKQNCQSVIVAFEARRKGLDVYALPYSAKPNSVSYELGERFQDAWINPKTGKVIEPTIIKGNTDDEILAKLRRQLNTDGRYVLGINEKNGRGHVVSIDRVNGKIIIKDEQTNDFISIGSLEDISYLEILRIDKAILNISKVKSILGVR